MSRSGSVVCTLKKRGERRYQFMREPMRRNICANGPALGSEGGGTAGGWACGAVDEGGRVDEVLEKARGVIGGHKAQHTETSHRPDFRFPTVFAPFVPRMRSESRPRAS